MINPVKFSVGVVTSQILLGAVISLSIKNLATIFMTSWMLVSFLVGGGVLILNF